MLRPRSLSVLSVVVLAAGSPACAASMSYVMTCTADVVACGLIGNATMTFKLPEFPSGTQSGDFFVIDFALGYWNGSTSSTVISLVLSNPFSDGAFADYGFLGVYWAPEKDGGSFIGGSGPFPTQGNAWNPQLLPGTFTFASDKNVVRDSNYLGPLSWNIVATLVPDPVDPSAIPLPATFGLLAGALGLGALLWLRAGTVARTPGRQRSDEGLRAPHQASAVGL